MSMHLLQSVPAIGLLTLGDSKYVMISLRGHQLRIRKSLQKAVNKIFGPPPTHNLQNAPGPSPPGSCCRAISGRTAPSMTPPPPARRTVSRQLPQVRELCEDSSTRRRSAHGRMTRNTLAQALAAWQKRRASNRGAIGKLTRRKYTEGY